MSIASNADGRQVYPRIFDAGLRQEGRSAVVISGVIGRLAGLHQDWNAIEPGKLVDRRGALQPTALQIRSRLAFDAARRRGCLLEGEVSGGTDGRCEIQAQVGREGRATIGQSAV